MNSLRKMQYKVALKNIAMKLSGRPERYTIGFSVTDKGAKVLEYAKARMRGEDVYDEEMEALFADDVKSLFRDYEQNYEGEKHEV